MGKILAKFRKEKSTQEVLEALQEKIDTLENFTLDTQEAKKRVVGNFLASSVGLYVIAFVAFYFVYFPPTWQERMIYFIPLILFPVVIFLLRRLFTWYYERKLNNNSKKLTVLRAEKKKMLDQVMNKETYKVAVGLLARFGDKPSSTSGTSYSAMNSSLRTPSKYNQSVLNRSLPAATTSTAKTTTMPLTPTILSGRTGTNIQSSSNMASQLSTFTPSTALEVSTPGNSSNQLVRRRTPFPIIDQHSKGVFEKIVDVLIGDGPGDRFAMICKECYAHNGMASKEDFEYTTYRCAFCNALNPARKSKPAAPRLSTMPIRKASDSSSDEKEDTDDDLSPVNSSDAAKFSTPLMASVVTRARDVSATSSVSSSEDERQPIDIGAEKPFDGNTKEKSRNIATVPETMPQEQIETVILEKSDSAINDIQTMSAEEH